MLKIVAKLTTAGLQRAFRGNGLGGGSSSGGNGSIIVTVDSRVESNLHRYRGVDGVIHGVLREAAFDVERRAKQLAAQQGIGSIDPDATGATINSIHVEDEGDAIRIGPSTEYAIYHELGTSKMAARPFLTPAFDEVKAELPGRVRDAIKRL